MRIPSGVTTAYAPFVALDATDKSTRETGLSSFTVYRSRNCAAEVAFTTPTITEIDATNMPGVYGILVDEDTTIDSGVDEQPLVLHITHAGMAPVTREIELYRAKGTIGETHTLSSGVGSANATHIAGSAVSTSTAQLGVNVVNWRGTAAEAPTTAGRIVIDAIPFSGATLAADLVAGGVASATNIATVNTKLAFLPAITAGAAGGLFIAGANAATTVGGVALSTLTAAGVWNTLTSTMSTAGSIGKLIADSLPVSATGGTGNGDVLVDHDYGLTDALRVVDNVGVPIDNAMIRAYVAADYLAGTIDPAPPTTYTGSDGRWIEPLMLDAEDYKMTVYNPLTKRTKSFDLTVA